MSIRAQQWAANNEFAHRSTKHYCNEHYWLEKVNISVMPIEGWHKTSLWSGAGAVMEGRRGGAGVRTSPVDTAGHLKHCRYIGGLRFTFCCDIKDIGGVEGKYNLFFLVVTSRLRGKSFTTVYSALGRGANYNTRAKLVSEVGSEFG
ncbi:hypothetical protein J6590_002192 [Homalodisca vitripennis]|nr:hypothetical protein J6590_002192 [Homalodisca vitripennis]